GKNPVLRWMTTHVPFVRRYHGNAMWLGHGSRRRFTPLFIVVVMIGITAVIFAVDSIPAIFAITLDPFIVLTSNVFAVLGLRAMFFLLAGMAERFHLLPYGLAVVLVFIGAKMLLVDLYKIPVLWSLGAGGTILATTIALSLSRPARAAADGCDGPAGTRAPPDRTRALTRCRYWASTPTARPAAGPRPSAAARSRSGPGCGRRPCGRRAAGG